MEQISLLVEIYLALRLSLKGVSISLQEEQYGSFIIKFENQGQTCSFNTPFHML